MKHKYSRFGAIVLLFFLGNTVKSQNKNVTPKLGKYGCTAAKYSGGSYQYIPKGSFTLKKDGTYIYSGFEKPSNGKFNVDEKGNLHFKGGYLNDGTAEKIDRPDKFFLVFPTIPDHRWTCGLVE
ncbi:hypothetical protein [Chryseobacterium koreense]